MQETIDKQRLITIYKNQLICFLTLTR